MGKRAILCVDDEAIITLSLMRELRDRFRERFVYETALSAVDALQLLDELAAEGIELALVISDWLMPGMNGDEFLKEVRRGHPEAKTILLTGHASAESLALMQEEALTNCVITKPWRRGELLDRAASLVGDSA